MSDDASAHPEPAMDEKTRKDIDYWRGRIDGLDTQLVRLLNSRSACAVEIGRIKRRAGLPIYSPEREAAVLARVMKESPGPLEPLAVRRVFERVIDESRRLERLAFEEETGADMGRGVASAPASDPAGPSGAIHSRREPPTETE